MNRKRLLILSVWVLAVTTGALLFVVSQNVQKTEREIARAEADIVLAQESLRVMRAEWDYLNRPDRLEALLKNLPQQSKPAAAASLANGLPDFQAPVIPVHKPAPRIKHKDSEQKRDMKRFESLLHSLEATAE